MRNWTAGRWIALAAAVTALAALGLSIYEGSRREYHGLELKPKAVTSYSSSKRGSGFSFANFGAGPALVRWTTVMVDGKVMPTWAEMIKAIGFEGNDEYTFNIPRYGWQPGSEEEIFWVKPGVLDTILRRENARVDIETCFCSVFEECWTTSRQEPEPKPVSSCYPRPNNFLRAAGLPVSAP